jgi:hypothetical protein
MSDMTLKADHERQGLPSISLLRIAVTGPRQSALLILLSLIRATSLPGSTPQGSPPRLIGRR